jgi:hypothetical protein
MVLLMVATAVVVSLHLFISISICYITTNLVSTVCALFFLLYVIDAVKNACIALPKYNIVKEYLEKIVSQSKHNKGAENKAEFLKVMESGSLDAELAAGGEEISPLRCFSVQVATEKIMHGKSSLEKSNIKAAAKQARDKKEVALMVCLCFVLYCFMYRY